MKKILTVVGARPQFVKAAIVSKALEIRGDTKEVLVHTGQHYDKNMSAIFFEELEIPPPTYNLGIGGGTHGQNTGRMLESLEGVLIQEKPDFVLVYGDTDSTLAGALASAKLHIPVAHVEAGLRSFNRRMPEELNRIITDQLSAYLFTPTQTALENLRKEGIGPHRIHPVGDVMYDATLRFSEIASRKSQILKNLHINPGYVLSTIHRQENTDSPERLKNILQGLGDCGRKVLLPLHPRTNRKLEALGLKTPGNIRILDPVGYLDMLALEKNASAIATDSGGVQKEAFFLKIPCITLRDETEWVELIQNGANVLTGANPEKISEAIQTTAPVPEFFPYGNGDAGNKIARILSDSVLHKSKD